MKSVKADNRRNLLAGYSYGKFIHHQKLWRVQIGYTCIHFNEIRDTQTSWGIFVFLSPWVSLHLKYFYFFCRHYSLFSSVFFIYVESFVPMQVAAIFWMHIIWIHTIKKLVKILWTSYRNGPIITSKNLIEKYKSNKMIMKYKSWIYILQNTWIFFF